MTERDAPPAGKSRVLLHPEDREQIDDIVKVPGRSRVGGG